MSDKKLTTSLTIVDARRQKTEYLLFDRRYLEVSRSQGKKQLNYRIDILALAMHSRTRWRLRWQWFAVALALLALAEVMRGGYLPLPGVNLAGLAPILLPALWGVALLCGVAGILSLRRLTVFYTLHSVVPLVKLSLAVFRDWGRIKEFKQFVHVLQTSIAHCQRHYVIKDHQQKAGEMRILRRMAQQGVIPKTDYESSKALLLGNIASAA